jgi:hypothetical protein
LQHTTDELRKKDLKTILYTYQNDDVSLEKEKARNKLNLIYDKIDENALKKQWSRLTLDQKINRLKLFLAETIKDEDKRNIKFEQILTLINNKKIKSSNIEYDKENGKIISIIYNNNITNPDT